MENKRLFTDNEAEKIIENSEHEGNKMFLTGVGILVGGFVAKKIYDKAIKPRIINAMADMMREAQNQINSENCKK